MTEAEKASAYEEFISIWSDFHAFSNDTANEDFQVTKQENASDAALAELASRIDPIAPLMTPDRRRNAEPE